jgi:hypothetical protein
MVFFVISWFLMTNGQVLHENITSNPFSLAAPFRLVLLPFMFFIVLSMAGSSSPGLSLSCAHVADGATNTVATIAAKAKIVVFMFVFFCKNTESVGVKNADAALFQAYVFIALLVG